MVPPVHIAHLQHQIETQLELAGLAACDAIRAMHEDLEKLYRARLVAAMLAQRLDPAERGRRDSGDSGDPAWRGARQTAASLAPSHMSVTLPA